MPERNPFVPRPIDIANDEIRVLKRTILEMRSDMIRMKSELKPLRTEYLKRKADEEQKDKECVVENNSWWFS